MNNFHLTYWDNLPNNYSIIQGALYSFTIFYPTTDISTYTFSGHIRKTFDDSNILARFNFSVVFGTVENKIGNYTIITCYLNASQTDLIPVPPKNRNSSSDAIKEGVNVWVYDIEAADPTNTENVLKIISKSWVEVVGGVTRE